MRKAFLFFLLLTVVTIPGAAALDESGLDGGNLVACKRGNCDGGGGIERQYTLLGRVRVDLNEAPSPPVGPALPGVDVLVEWDRDNGLPGCDGVFQANQGDILRLTASDNPDTPGDETGRFSVNGLVSGRTYCLHFSKSGFYNRTILWPTSGTGDMVDFTIQEIAQDPVFWGPAGSTFAAQEGVPLDNGNGEVAGILFEASDLNIADTVELTVIGSLPGWMSIQTLSNPGNPAKLAITGTPPSSAVGQDFPFVVRAEDVWEGTTDKPFTITLANRPPVFLVPSGNSSTPVEVGETRDYLFVANDTAGETVTLSLIGGVPPWIDCGGTNPAGNPVFRTCRITPTANHIGSTFMTMEARDNHPTAPLATQVTLTIHVPRFRDVTSTNLPSVPVTPTRGADAGDIDGDGDRDLVVAHPPSASVGNQILINNHPSNPGIGRFTEDTAGRLPTQDAQGFPIGHEYHSFSIRLASQQPGGVPDLFLTDVRRRNDGHQGPNWPDPNGWFEDGSYMRNGYWVPSYRLKNDGTGRFLGHDWIDKWETERFIMSSPMIGNSFGGIDAGFGADVEVVKAHPTQLNAFFAGTLLGEFLPDDNDADSNPEQYVYYAPTEPLFWRDDMSAYDFAFGSFAPDNVTPDCPWTPPCVEGPRTSDIEFADIDGDGDLDAWTAGSAFDGSPPGDFPFPPPPPPPYNYPPRIYLNNGTGYFGTLIRQTDFGLSLPPAGNFITQKGQFSDLNGDGRVDLVMVDPQTGVRILRNIRGGSAHGNVAFILQNVPPHVAAGDSLTAADADEVTIGDLNRDGKPDLIVVSVNTSLEKVFLNTTTPWPHPGTITFEEAPMAIYPKALETTYCSILFDMDNDGDKDLFMCNYWRDRLFENLTPP